MPDTKQAEISHPHDHLVKNFLKDIDLASNLFKNYLSKDWVETVDFDSLKRESTDTVDRNLAERRADFRFSAKLKGVDEELGVFVYLEHQSRSDRFMAFRLLEYICAAYRQHLSAAGEKKDTAFPPPLTVVLHHGKTPWKKVLTMRELFNSQHALWHDTLKFPICLIDLARIPGEQLRGHPAVCTLLDSLQSGSAGELTERVTGIVNRLQNVRADSRLDAWVTALATYYFAVQGKVQKNFDTWSQALKALYSAREAEKMTLTFAESWIAEGIALGKAEGKAEGEARGQAKGKVESVILFLETRFGEIPASIRKKVARLQDDRRIEDMIKLAATCQSLKEFQKAL